VVQGRGEVTRPTLTFFLVPTLCVGTSSSTLRVEFVGVGEPRVDAVEKLIAAYHTAPFDTRGEAWGKVAALEALEDHLTDPRVLPFFLQLIGNPDEYDMARVHLLKLLELDPLPEAAGQIGETIVATLAREKDMLVRSWLSRAAGGFSHVPVVLNSALAGVQNVEEDDAVRSNFLAVLTGRGVEPAVVEVLRKLAQADGNLGDSARRYLNE
jgi:hypothetical protein